jgi:hypothetical protein
MAKLGYAERLFYPTVWLIPWCKDKCPQGCLFATFATTPVAAILLILHSGQTRIIQTTNVDKGGKLVALAMGDQSFLSKMCCVFTNPAKRKKSLHRSSAYANPW